MIIYIIFFFLQWEFIYNHFFDDAPKMPFIKKKKKNEAIELRGIIYTGLT